MSEIILSGIFSEGYGINPKKIWKLKIGEYPLKSAVFQHIFGYRRRLRQLKNQISY